MINKKSVFLCVSGQIKDIVSEAFHLLHQFIRLFNFFNSFILIQLLLQSNLWLIFKISVSLADKYKKQII